jgi:hypothetical protein
MPPIAIGFGPLLIWSVVKITSLAVGITKLSHQRPVD